MPKKKSEKLDPEKYSHYLVECKSDGNWALYKAHDSLPDASISAKWLNDVALQSRIVRVTVSKVEIVK